MQSSSSTTTTTTTSRAGNGGLQTSTHTTHSAPQTTSYRHGPNTRSISSDASRNQSKSDYAHQSNGHHTSYSDTSSKPAKKPKSDHPLPHQMGHGYGETSEQHAEHSKATPEGHWGLPDHTERLLFYAFAIPSWCMNIVAGIIGSYYDTADIVFEITCPIFLALSWAAWWQTVVQMMQRASWVRDESNLADRKRFLELAVRLNRLMLPTAVISFVFFIVAYVRREDTDDLANWLVFLIVFIANTVGCVMNAYNNITWESDRLEYEEGSSPYGNTMLAILGIPSKPRKQE